MIIGESQPDFRQYIPEYSSIGENVPYFRQYTIKTFGNWRMSTVLSPIHSWTFAIGECPVGESLIGEVRKPHKKLSYTIELDNSVAASRSSGDKFFLNLISSKVANKAWFPRTEQQEPLLE